MRILNTNTHLDPVTGGGTAERTFQMSRYLIKSGHHCAILTTDNGMTEARRVELSATELIAMPCLVDRIFLPHIPVQRVKNAVRTSDILHLMGHWSIVNVIAYLYARAMSKPYVVCPAGTLNIYGRSTLMKRGFNAVVGTRIIRNASGHIAISKDEIDHFARMGIDRQKIAVIPNGIHIDDYADDDVESFRTQYGIGPNPYILYMGRLNYYKGPDLLLEAFGRVKDELRNFKLLVAGPDEDMLQWMKKYVADHSLEGRVVFLEHISGAQKSRAYHGSEIVVIPSRRDAMSIVVLEAGAVARPVILTNKCGFDEVQDVDGGLIVDASVDGIAGGLLEYARNKERFKKMGENLQCMTVERYSWDRIIDQLTSYYQEVLDRRGAAIRPAAASDNSPC